MGKRAPDERLSEFQARLNRVKEHNSMKASTANEQKQSGYGMAFVIAADLVGGLIGGVAIGWLVDRWLGLAPMGLVLFFFLGAAAGMWNVYRTVRGYDMSLGFGRQPTGPAAPEDEAPLTTGARANNKVGDHRGQSTPSV